MQLNQMGAHLALCDVDQDGLEETKSMLIDASLPTTLHRVDVSDYDAMQTFSEAVIGAHTHVDILINNAGITLTPKVFVDIPHDQFERVININMWGVYHGIRHFLPHLMTREEAVIANVSSTAGLVGLYGYTPYTTSKFAVRAISEALQMELQETGVSVLAVYPGGIKTDLVRNAPDLAEDKREQTHQSFTQSALLTPEKAAAKIIRAIQRKRKRLVLGVDAHITLFIRNAFPRAFPNILAPIFSRSPFNE